MIIMKTRYLSLPILLVGITLILGSCKKLDSSVEPIIPPIEVTDKIAPDAFNFSTTREVKVNVRLLTNNGMPIKGVIISLFKTNSHSVESAIFKAISDENGYARGTVNLPAYIDTLVIEPNYIGLLSGANAIISNNAINATIGGPAGYSGDVILKPATYQRTPKAYNQILATSFAFPNGKNVNNNVDLPSGKPKYLSLPSDVINAPLLTSINSTLKEGIAVTNTALLDASAVSILNVTSASDVYVTFVYSEAGFSNTIGYYSYPTNTPPQSVADITKVTYIFPNAKSVTNGLVSGDRVKLGQFAAGTSIGFVLLQNAWTGSDINLSVPTFFSTVAINPETNLAFRRHSVLMYDSSNKLFVVGLEDLLRTSSTSSDNDFNDVVLYATTTAVGGSTRTNGISSTGVAPMGTLTNDQDNDGVIDNIDEFPTDPTRAYTTYFPSKVSWGTIAFEDNFPKTGDYDMNDLVVKYRYSFISNASNNIVELKGDYAIAAAGASYKNGFGVQFPFDGSVVSQVTGQRILGTVIPTLQFNSNGLEAGQTKAVIIPFDNTDILIKNTIANRLHINTWMNEDKLVGDTVHVKVTFTSPITPVTLGNAPFNPFLISNKRRGYEIHLPGYLPTNKMDNSLFGTEADSSLPTTGRYFKTASNWPWALSFTETFNYPIETFKITDAFPHFKDWAGSNLTTAPYLDWYSNTATGYRQTNLIYSK